MRLRRQSVVDLGNAKTTHTGKAYDREHVSASASLPHAILTGLWNAMLRLTRWSPLLLLFVLGSAVVCGGVRALVTRLLYTA